MTDYAIKRACVTVVQKTVVQKTVVQKTVVQKTVVQNNGCEETVLERDYRG
ncbi:hypothetical protein [Cryobacterium sp. PH29-G1]|uniref:hypothetical protein n=1 Tax=Cryobacterium sp. PH29-G1 TaxID=3046211 RepID=UPI0024B9938B|nr:hypothetical protein [Cryobacterium sp. PH29-G1]MDJ0348537.1 hypothetical protein [Cryobacterium sp. PH29-G1]